NWPPRSACCRMRRASGSGCRRRLWTGCRNGSPGRPSPGPPWPSTGGLSPSPTRERSVLTVNYELLKIEPGDRVLDLGCGAGRHAFEAARRGAQVVAVDLDRSELEQVSALFAAMAEAGEIPAGGSGIAVSGDATCLPFPDGS